MTEVVNMMSMARALSTHANARQQLLARNVANADTPGFRAQDLGSFDRLVESGTLGPGLTMAATRPGHLTGEGWRAAGRVVNAGSEASPNGNTVSLEEEMFRQAEIRREHQMALSVYESGLRVTRGALGRR